MQLVYQDWRTEWFPPMAQKELTIFQTEHPNLSVFYTPDPENLADQMPLDMQAGNAADVFQGCCEFFPAWNQKGYVLDLRKYVETDLDPAIVADWDPAQYKAFFDASGRQFGVPKYQGTLVLYYNKDIFDEYGVAYPDASWTHDDYLAAMKKLTHDTNGDGKTDIWGSMIDIGWDRLQVHINAWGGHIVDPSDPTKCVIDSPEALAALEWVRARMWDDKVMATFTDVNNVGTQAAFYGGKLAMVEDGSWALKNILENANFRIGVAPMPTGPAKRVTLSTTDGFGIYSRHAASAGGLGAGEVPREQGVRAGHGRGEPAAAGPALARPGLAAIREGAVPGEGQGHRPRRVRRRAPRRLLGRPGGLPQQHGRSHPPARRRLHEDLHPRSSSGRHLARREPADRSGSDERRDSKAPVQVAA